MNEGCVNHRDELQKQTNMVEDLRFIAETLQETRKLHAEGLSNEKIAEKLGLSGESRVRHILKFIG